MISPPPAVAPSSASVVLDGGVGSPWLERIVAGASTLDERLGDGFEAVPGAEPEGLARARLARWRERVAGGDPRRFERRLRWDGLDPERVRAALGEVRLRVPDALPGWARLLGEVVAESRRPERARADEGAEVLGPGEPLPFGELLLPFLRVARMHLARSAGDALSPLAPSARRGLERALLGRLAALCGRALHVEFSAFRAVRGVGGAYAAFVRRMREGGLEETFARLPVLARMAAVQTERWVEATAELARRVEEDHALLARTFAGGAAPGPVVEVRADLSDPHRGGRTVAMLRFASGLRVVLKPRGMAMDAAWNGLLAWLGGRAGLSLPEAPAVLDRGTHGWAAWVEPAACLDAAGAERFHERAGMLLGLAYALGGGDFHADNLVARGSDPVLVDLEVLLASPVARVAPEDGSVPSAIDRATWESVLRTGLLPSWGTHGDGPARREGGLALPDSAGARREVWRHAGTDLVAPVMEAAPPREASSVPRVGDALHPAARYVDAVEAGFARVHGALREHRDALLAPDGPLEAFAPGEARLVLRHTRVYATLLRRSLHPRFLASGVERSIELDVLCRPLLRSAERPRVWPVLRSERRDLEGGDVPVFTARAGSVEVRDSAGEPVGDLLDAPGLDEAAHRLRGMDDADLDVQSQLVRISFAVAGDGASGDARPEGARSADGEEGGTRDPASGDVSAEDGFSPSGDAAEEGFSPAEALEEAVAVAERLARVEAVRADGSAGWIGLVPGAERFGYVDGHSFAAGTPGIALFLAACGEVAERDDLRDLARRALRPTVRLLGEESSRSRLVDRIGTGGATGVGGLVYVLTRAGRWLGDDEVRAAAWRAALALAPRHGAEDSPLDVYGGSAGAVLGLLALHGETGDAEVLERARTCGMRLVSALSGGGGRGAADALATSGFAHGLSGIAHALHRLHSVTGDDGLGEAATRAGARLRRLFAPAQGNWRECGPGDADGEPWRCSWCHGAAGIALAAAGAPGQFDAGERSEVAAALATVARWPLEAADYLCCGNLGRAECLLTASTRLCLPELRARALALAGDVVRRARRRRTYGTAMPDAYAPGFLQGVAGIGYALLRLHAPDRLPSALLWE